MSFKQFGIAVFSVIGALWVATFLIDGITILRERVVLPAFVNGAASSSSLSATEISRLQQACGDDTELPACTSRDHSDVVMHGGLGLKGSLTLKSRSLP